MPALLARVLTSAPLGAGVDHLAMAKALATDFAPMTQR